jgi:oligopeptidase A
MNKLMNPLRACVGLPKFELIQSNHVTPAVDEILAENTKLLDRLIHDDIAPTWSNFVLPMEDANELLSCAWGPVSHLNSVMNTDELREAYNENLPKLTQYYAEMAQNLALYDKFKQLKQSDAFELMSVTQKKIIENELRDFRLGGAELSPENKVRFLEIQEQLSKFASQFEENILDATNAFGLIISDVNELGGLPEDVLQSASELAAKENSIGWKFTLHAPSYFPVMQYAENRALRENLYKSYATRASEFEPAQWDNSSLITQIVSLRHEAAVMLGFENYADLSLATKMAESQQQIESFLMSLAQRARQSAEADLAELKSYAKAKLGISELQSWDIGFASEKLRLEKYAYSDQELKQYFPEDQVLQGLFKLLNTLYGLTVSLADAQVWHKDVQFYAIHNPQGGLVGQFYLDLYAREHKRGGAWMDDALARRRKGADIQIPVAYLTCNFSAPVGNKPAIFTHDEVITLFHEFGHGLHHMLTRVEELGVSGISGVEWDAVELPSQFMENFCWEWEVLRHMTKHVDTGEALPRALFDKMLAAKNFQSGLQTLRQVEFSLFDLRLHSGVDIQTTSALQVLAQIRELVAVINPPDYNRFPNNFSHIFAGGYAAGYYSYKWAEVLSADAYSLFEEHGVLSAEIGEKFWTEILSVGGSRPALDSFIAFRGREPSIDALLRHNGMS